MTTPTLPTAFMFDLDGTLILSDRALGGYRALPGAAEALTTLEQRGIPFVAMTNGSAYPPSVQAPKLRALGLPIRDEALLTPSSVAADLMVRRGVTRALVLGTPGVGHALAEAGITTFHTGGPDPETADAVYVGWHPECGMPDIEAACRAIWAGASLYVASDAPFFASSAGKSPGYSRAIGAAIRSLTGAPMTLTGKPSLHALRLVARTLATPMRRIGVVGDDPLVEIVMARRAGGMGFGVSSGVTSAEAWAALPKRQRPHQVLDGVGDLLACFDQIRSEPF
jgi:HAD superfamily hydrolase (TIGR01450 family)